MLSTSSREHLRLPHYWVLVGLFHFLLQHQQKKSFRRIFLQAVGTVSFQLIKFGAFPRKWCIASRTYLGLHLRIFEVPRQTIFYLTFLRPTKNSNFLAYLILPLSVAFLVEGAFFYCRATNFVVFLGLCYILHQMHHGISANYVSARHLSTISLWIVKRDHVWLKGQLKSSSNLVERNLLLPDCC